VLDDTGWARIGQGLPDSPEVLAAHLRAVAHRRGAVADGAGRRAHSPPGLIADTPLSLTRAAFRRDLLAAYWRLRSRRNLPAMDSSQCRDQS
jgi:hypothetical protein